RPRPLRDRAPAPFGRRRWHEARQRERRARARVASEEIRYPNREPEQTEVAVLQPAAIRRVDVERRALRKVVLHAADALQVHVVGRRSAVLRLEALDVEIAAEVRLDLRR